MLHFSPMQTSSNERSFRCCKFFANIQISKLPLANQHFNFGAKYRIRLAHRLPFSSAKFRSKRGQEKKQGQEKRERHRRCFMTVILMLAMFATFLTIDYLRKGKEV